MTDPVHPRIAGAVVLSDATASAQYIPSGAQEVEEQTKFRERMSAERHAAYRSGRGAAHHALEAWRPGETAAHTEVLRGPLGGPIALRSYGQDRGEIARVSIAHCPGWAAAAVSECGRPIGVDVEPRPSTSQAALIRALSARETEAATAANLAPADAALIVWTAREAAGKTLRTGLVVASGVLEVAEIGLIADDTYEVRYARLPAISGIAHLGDEVVLAAATPCRRSDRVNMIETDATSSMQRLWWVGISRRDVPWSNGAEPRLRERMKS
ncbi:4'-phosphopantetheinyl transferase EntD [Arthrobacter pigmenti]|uniref:4'-phosphopantetheinyl transferase EntD n=1 Tax=Arthrobacter pigmenti TaxID=271432 RepID=A0A846RR15_9MICC|nr:4'-phosphopantetheinyl transferase superfamily protein [Arthrobacter pigmenti]NJC22165.1 4'-phosphopantetheinyl transferase EntD [Arthrobacter pigmenti]